MTLEGEQNLTVASEDIYPDAIVKVSRDQYSVFELKRMVEETQALQLAPPFQRHGVWSLEQKRELIESVLMGIPIPVVYVFEDEDGIKQMVDGRQRISTLIDFMHNRFALKDLKMLPSFDGMKFNDLPPLYKNKLERYQVPVYVIEPPTPERVKYDIFDRVNRGGTQINNQEMRHALYNGPASCLLQELSESAAFKRATGRSIETKRMRDRYVILRFLAFYLLRRGQLKFPYRSNIDDLLAAVMKAINKQPEHQIETLRHLFLTAMERAYATLGEDAFRFASINNKRRPINMALFETITYFFAILDPEYQDSERLAHELHALKRRFDTEGLLKTNVDSTTHVEYRFGAVEHLVESLTCCNA